MTRAMLLPTNMVLTKLLGWRKKRAIAFWDTPFFSRSISARMRLLDTKAISIPEKKAEKTIATSSPMICGVSCAI